MSKIEWTDKTWNPIIGCRKVSEGCQNCYAERMAHRQAHMEEAKAGRKSKYGQVVSEGPNHGKWNGRTIFVESSIKTPLYWQKPSKIFVGSMTDIFRPTVPFAWVDQIFAIMALSPQHTFQVLTKWPERMRQYFLVKGAGGTWEMICVN